MRIVFTILLYLIGVQSSLSETPIMMDSNICSSEEKNERSCELHCISNAVESKYPISEEIFRFEFFIQYFSPKIKISLLDIGYLDSTAFECKMST